MIIGNGLLANEFDVYKNSNDVTIFASGVSNSNEKRGGEFEREMRLLRSEADNDECRLLIYFSSTKVFESGDNDNLYIKHKKDVEKFINENFKSFLIFRLPQVIGKGGNPNTLANNIYNK